MPWRPLRHTVHAVCIRQFDLVEPDDIALEVGDDVYITEVSGSDNVWCRGWLVSQPSILTGLTSTVEQSLKPRAYSGIFPKDCVEIREVLDGETDGENNELGQEHGIAKGHGEKSVVEGARSSNDALVGDKHGRSPSTGLTRGRSIKGTRIFPHKPADAQLDPVDVLPQGSVVSKKKAPLPALKIGDSATFSSEEPLVDEISSCLREWHSTKLQDLVLKREYQLLDKVSKLVLSLDSARKQLIHDLLTQEELADLRERTIWDLVDGNKMLDGAVIVRNPKEKGRILTAHDSVPEMLKLQAIMGLRSRPPFKPPQESGISHLLVDIKHFPDINGQPGILHMYICHQVGDTRPRPISEVYAVEAPSDNQRSSSVPSGQQSRTLFTDLTKAEIGSASDPSSRVYLICLLHREEPYRADTDRRTTTPTPSLPQQERPSRGDDMEEGRRSFFGSQRGRRLMERSRSRDAIRPTTADSTRSKLQKQQSFNGTITENEPSTAEKTVRRVVGYGAVDVGAVVRQHDQKSVSISLWTPEDPFEHVHNEYKLNDRECEQVLKHLARSTTGQFVRANMIGDFHVDLRAFAHVDAASLIREMPAMLHDVHCTPALHASATLSQPRSDVYLTLQESILPRHARCFHPQEGSVPLVADTELRNLQLTLEVRTESGKRVENAIWPASNRPPHTAFRTPAIERGDVWDQTLRLSIPAEDLPRAHVVLSIADGKSFPFALAWLPLWDARENRCLSGQRLLAFWDYSEYTASTVNGRGAYQSLPSHMYQINTEDKSVMAALKVDLSPSNSTIPQDSCVSALLSWDGETVQALVPVLDNFRLAKENDIIRFFPQILSTLDNLFDVLYRDKDDAEDRDPTATSVDHLLKRALSCLVCALHTTRDRRFSGSEDLLDRYLQTRQSTLPRHSIERSQSSKAMCHALRAFFSRPSEFEEARELRSLLKVSGQLIKFIVNGCNPPTVHSNTDVSDPLRSVLAAAVYLMRNPQEALTGTQTMFMQEFASWFPHLALAMTPEELLEAVDNMMIASAKKHGPLRITRLVMVKEISLLELFDTSDMRPKLLARTKQWLADYWLSSEEYTNDQLNGVRMCCSVLETQHPDINGEATHYIPKLFEAYYVIQGLSRSDTDVSKPVFLQRTGKTLSLLFPSTYPFPTVPTDREDVPNEAALEIVAVLTSFFQEGLPRGKSSSKEQDDVETQDHYISRGLQVLQSIQSGDAFPSGWLSFAVTHSKYAVTMLELFLNLLIDHYIPFEDENGESDMMSFNTELWVQWFKTLTQLARGKVVSVEDSPDQSRRAVWTVGGDIRRTAAALLRRGWLALGWKVSPDYERAMFPMDHVGGYQVSLTAKVVPFAVDLSMSLHPDLKSVGLDILRSMVVSEWQLNGDLEVLQAAFFDTFDRLHREDKPHTRHFAAAYLEQLKRYFALLQHAPEPSLHQAVMSMIEDVEQLLGALGELSTVHDPASRSLQVVRLIDFLRQTGREDAFIRRVHEMSDLQKHARNYSSAATVLQLHLDLLNKSQVDQGDTRVLEALSLPGFELPAEAIVSRKNRLYRLMATYYEKANHWDKVLEMLGHLAHGHQLRWDVSSLASVRTEEARVCTMLATGSPNTPRFFRVEFSRDDNFPASFRGKQYIFEGPANCDKKAFALALKAMLPCIINPESDYITLPSQGGGATVKISPVTPYKDHLHPVNQQSGIAPSYREQCLIAQPSIFAITNRHDVPNVGVTDRLVEKTIYKTKESFPTILSYSEIIHEEKAFLPPIKAAIDRTQRKTLILNSITELAVDRGESQAESLIELIRASVDPAASGSVAEYHKLLSTTLDRSSAGSSLNRGSLPDGKEDATEPENVVLRRSLAVALEDHAYAIETALKSPLVKGATKKDLRACFEVSFILELHCMYPLGDWRTKSPAWVDTKIEEVPVVAPIERQNSVVAATDEDRPEPQRKNSTGRRRSLRKRLSFLSIGGKSINKDSN